MRFSTACLFAASLTTLHAHGKEHLIEVAWPASGAFATDLRIPPGKFREVCAPLKKAERVEWSFSSPADSAFNIHYHVGSEVIYPAKVEALRDGKGTLLAAVDQHYCWMWKAAGTETEVRVTLQRR